MPEHARRILSRVTGLALVVVMAGCAGENLFAVVAGVGAVGPKIDITAPTAGFTSAQGAAVTVQGTAEAADGINTLEYSGVFKDTGAAAFTAETESYPASTVVNFDNDLLFVAGAGTGSVYIIVKGTDASGEFKADTIEITVN